MSKLHKLMIKDNGDEGKVSIIAIRYIEPPLAFNLQLNEIIPYLKFNRSFQVDMNESELSELAHNILKMIREE